MRLSPPLNRPPTWCALLLMYMWTCPRSPVVLACQSGVVIPTFHVVRSYSVRSCYFLQAGVDHCGDVGLEPVVTSTLEVAKMREVRRRK